MPADLLFELGCEEIPAKMLAKQLADLPALVEKLLAAARIAHAGVTVLGTPRRIAVVAKQLADRQPDLDEEVVGPLYSVAVVDGKLSKAGEGWAKKTGVTLEQIAQREVPGKKGVYAIAKKHAVGEATRALLPGLLRELCAAMPWPKSQRWGWGETTFVRPVQWLLSLYGGEVVGFEWAGITSGRRTRGHRFLANRWIDLGSAAADGYAKALRDASVVVDPAERKQTVRDELARIERETGLRVRPDDQLVDEVINLGELPVGLVGSFDPAFLNIPEEIAVTTMRNNQRVFVLEDPATGRLAPKFATMMATRVTDDKLVRAGNEKVIASRLSDGVFFFAEDKKKGFDVWNGKLDAVVFQAKLGDGKKTIGDKLRRIAQIVDRYGDATAGRAARLCKADLASHAVGEFPELQGTMGKHYALHFGEPEPVARAIEEHWWPKGQGAAVPTTRAGALVALADKMDTIVGCFAVGLEPSGSNDPLGLRRAAIGIWQILLAYPELQYEPLVAQAKQALGATLDDTKLAEFFKQRLRGIFTDSGIAAQDADAALAQDFTNPVDARLRAQACAKISKEAREVFKRVANILDDARGKQIAIGLMPDPARFVHDTERNLHAAVARAQQEEAGARHERNYQAVFESLEALRPTVAAFFDKGGVMVMDPDPVLRDNRLALLNWFVTPYASIADFRLLAGAAS